jgi:hypothetical protein
VTLHENKWHSGLTQECAFNKCILFVLICDKKSHSVVKSDGGDCIHTRWTDMRMCF